MTPPSDHPPRHDFARTAAGMAALAHPVRLAILSHLSARPSCCCGEVVAEFDLAQSTVSQHLKVLVDAGLVRQTLESRRSRYAVDLEAVKALACDCDTIFRRCCG